MTHEPTNPDRILRPLSDVPAYINRRYGRPVSQQTVYNWKNRGRNGRKLQTMKKSPIDQQVYTTWEWVRDFIAESTT